jgi:hypothetical protein
MGRYYDMNTAKTDIRALLCLAVSEIAILVNIESHSRCFLQTLETLIIPRFFAKNVRFRKTQFALFQRLSAGSPIQWCGVRWPVGRSSISKSIRRRSSFNDEEHVSDPALLNSCLKTISSERSVCERRD